MQETRTAKEELLKERFYLALDRMKEMKLEGLPDLEKEKAGKPFACFLKSLISAALTLALGEESPEETVPEKTLTEHLSDEIFPLCLILQGEVFRITGKRREADVIRMELLLQILGELQCRAMEGEKIEEPEVFQNALYWFYSDYGETVLESCLREATEKGLTFPGAYGKSLPCKPGILEWQDLAEGPLGKQQSASETEQADSATGMPELSLFMDANLANRRLEALEEALKTLSEEGIEPEISFRIFEDLCRESRSYRHFVKHLKEFCREKNIMIEEER